MLSDIKLGLINVTIISNLPVLADVKGIQMSDPTAAQKSDRQLKDAKKKEAARTAAAATKAARERKQQAAQKKASQRVEQSKINEIRPSDVSGQATKTGEKVSTDPRFTAGKIDDQAPDKAALNVKLDGEEALPPQTEIFQDGPSLDPEAANAEATANDPRAALEAADAASKAKDAEETAAKEAKKKAAAEKRAATIARKKAEAEAKAQAETDADGGEQKPAGRRRRSSKKTEEQATADAKE
jgi:hypothetical protein